MHNYSGRNVQPGEVFYRFIGTTYGCVDTSAGVALLEEGESVYPFFEFPLDAVRELRDDG
jgi:hypothetical protein